jgi:hypothetical protein
MTLRWVALSGMSALVLVACGSSSDGDGGGAGNATAGSTGTTNGGSTSDGGASSAGGASSGGSTASGGSSGTGSGVTPGVDCRGRTTNHLAGTRIRARNAVTSEGDRSWRGWHDSERGEDCEFMTAADGKLRCLPRDYRARFYFTDPACSDKVVTFVEDDCSTTAPKYFLSTEVESEGCDEVSRTAVHELGEPYDAAGALYTYDGARNCVAASDPRPGPYYRKGTEVPPSAFVEAENRRWDGPAAISTLGFVGADGLLQVTGWADPMHGDLECYFQLAEDGVERCLPFGNATFSWYYEADCSSPLLFSSVCAEGEQGYAGAEVRSECGSKGTAIYRRGSKFTGEPYEKGIDACTPAVMDTPITLYTRGEQVPSSEFTGVTPTRDETDGGRLEPVYHESPEGACWFRGWYDTTLETECTFELMSDGKLHCVPDVVPATSLIPTYSDPECLVEDTYVPYVEPCPGATLPRYVRAPIEASLSSCSSFAVIYRIGEVVHNAELPTLYRKSSGSCGQASLTASSYVRLGAKLPPSTFMEADLMVE